MQPCAIYNNLSYVSSKVQRVIKPSKLSKRFYERLLIAFRNIFFFFTFAEKEHFITSNFDDLT